MKKKIFSKVKAVKENARDRVGIVPSTKVIPDKRRRVKHKKELLQEEREICLRS